MVIVVASPLARVTVRVSPVPEMLPAPETVTSFMPLSLASLERFSVSEGVLLAI